MFYSPVLYLFFLPLLERDDGAIAQTVTTIRCSTANDSIEEAVATNASKTTADKAFLKCAAGEITPTNRTEIVFSLYIMVLGKLRCVVPSFSTYSGIVQFTKSLSNMILYDSILIFNKFFHP
jgi:hypothetical protein